METRAKTTPSGDFVLSGSKNWITNSPIADVFVVWAKDDAGVIRGYILEKARRVCVPHGCPMSCPVALRGLRRTACCGCDAVLVVRGGLV